MASALIWQRKCCFSTSTTNGLTQSDHIILDIKDMYSVVEFDGKL